MTKRELLEKLENLLKEKECGKLKHFPAQSGEMTIKLLLRTLSNVLNQQTRK